jgi:hypothetical protein
MTEPAKSGQVTIEVEGQRYTAHYVVDGELLRVSNEIGTLTTRYRGGSAPYQAEKLLARLVHEERRG